jgi:excisionase family DNA binding protein
VTGDAVDERLVYTLEEAAALLQISPETYYRGVREGKFPGRKVGGQWRVSRKALHRYAEGDHLTAQGGEVA